MRSDRCNGRHCGVFPLPDSKTETCTDAYSYEMCKGCIGTYSDDDTNVKLQCKSVKHHIICTDTSAKLDTVASE